MGEPFDTVEVEAERLRQRSRAAVADGSLEEALADAASAAELLPSSPPHLEHLGDVSLAAARAREAVRAYRRALGLAAKGGAAPRLRARLYRKIGQAEERRGDVDAAYDAYRMALQVDPQEPHAARRMAAMEEAAGLR
jgi:tetratricopeptide (TPR) repeat protein